MSTDPETVKILTEGEEMALMTRSTGWAIASQKIADKIMDLQMIGNVEGATNEEKVINMEARKLAVNVLVEFLTEIRSGVLNHEANKNALRDAQESGFIDRGLESGTSGQ